MSDTTAAQPITIRRRPLADQIRYCIDQLSGYATDTEGAAVLIALHMIADAAAGVEAERDQWRRDYFAASVERGALLQTAHERDQALTANTRLQAALDDAERRLSELAVQWGVRWPEGLVTEYSGQDVARHEAVTEPGVTVVCRLLGPWRDAKAGGEAQARPSED